VNRTVLDASAILAVLRREPGAEAFLQKLNTLPPTAVSVVNLAEVHAKLVQHGASTRDAWEAARASAEEIFDFDQKQAKISGDLIAQTHAYGLSLGDRACLALATVLKAPVYTADHAWKKLKVGIDIHVIR
jgi:ribonuclease VapC